MSKIDIIAKEAGVSPATVSKALNGYRDVGAATRERVLETARRMGYSPSPAARNLAVKRSKLIGLLLSDVKDTDANGNIIFRIFMGAKRACEERGYEIVLLTTDHRSQMEKSLADLCGEQRLAGCIVYGLTMSDPYYREILTGDTPCVAIDIELLPDRKKGTTPIRNPRLSVVTTDNAAAVAEVVGLLYDKGHRRIGFVNGLRDAEISIIREACFSAALAERGLAFERRLVRYADFLEDRAHRETLDLLAAEEDISAIFCASDLMAVGAYRAISELGLRIPDDVAVVGFDGIQIAEYLSPRLTTVVQDFKGMVHAAAGKLIDALGGGEVSFVDYAPYKLRVRESV